MSNRPRAVDFLDDEGEHEFDNRKENLTEEEPAYVSEGEAQEQEFEGESEGELEPELEDRNIETLPSGAISKGTFSFHLCFVKISVCLCE